MLTEERATTDKRSRFKNEIAFLTRNKHRNIVTVLDHGLSRGDIVGPFYVMRRYHSNLRDLMKSGIRPTDKFPLFSQILDGIEAAHFLGVVHRDLKPENILHDRESNTLAIADFGTARFTEDLVATIVETGPGQRLANFQYAAPEQRVPGAEVRAAADIYALGLILNELFTGVVPHGTEPRRISQADPEQGYLDEIVSKMLRQVPGERPSSIAELKGLIQKHHSEAVSLQRVSAIDGTVIKSIEIDEPLAETPPRLVAAEWGGGQLTLTLDRAVSREWVAALGQMGSYSSVMGKGPTAFSFHGNQATVRAAEHEAQQVVDNFKVWLPQATRALRSLLEQAARKQEAARKEELRRERDEEERRLRVNRSLRV